MSYINELNDKQYEAVRETEGYLRVIAGAGSGKTKLLVSRYVYLVKEYGIDPANILCVTFTNKAAGEMKRRIRALIGDEHDTSLICTYHGFCLKVLREDVEKIFYPKEFQIIDTSQQKAILGEIYQKMELKLDHASFEKIVEKIIEVKAKRDYVQKMCCTEKCQIMKYINTTDDQIIEEYMQRQKQIYAMDFSDLMYFALDIFKRCPDVLRKWQDRLNYIQVDEFQDSSKTEMELIDLLSGKHRNLMIVGDPDQNIYEWRGSDVKLLVEFDKRHENTKTIFLNQNYRSTPEILTCANTLIEKNVFRLKKDLFTKNPNGKKVYHYHMKTEYEESEKIVEMIQNMKKDESWKFSDFAVLYRSGFLSRIIEKKFTECGIPYEIYGGVKFYQRMEIQDIMAYLRLAAYDDDLAFKRIVNKPRRRFGRVKMQHLLSLQEQGESLYTTLKNNIDDPVFKNSDVKKFVHTIDQLRAREEENSLKESIEFIYLFSGYEKYIRELGDMERFENLTEFKRIAIEYEKNYGEEITLKEFINQISLQASDNGNDEEDKVKLMTIHAAKGLEFPHVFLLGMSEGVFPSAKTIEERKEYGLEEERRLCYVAITRAEKSLTLLDSEGFSQNGSEKIPSRFLREIGEENYIRVGNISKEIQQAFILNQTKNTENTNQKEMKKIGDSVVHPAFGTGKIVGFGKNNHSYKIKFDKFSSERDISVDFFDRANNNILPERRKQPEVTEVPKEFVVHKELEEERIVPMEDSTNISNQNSDNLWLRDDVPKTGWECVGITDLGKPIGICEMCGHQIIRYVHHMKHPHYRMLKVGCVCAGKMEGDIEKAKKREQEFKNKEARRETFLNKAWRVSKNQNLYLKIKDQLIVLYCNPKTEKWKFSVNGKFCDETYDTKEQAINAVFEVIDTL